MNYFLAALTLGGVLLLLFAIVTVYLFFVRRREHLRNEPAPPTHRGDRGRW